MKNSRTYAGGDEGETFLEKLGRFVDKYRPVIVYGGAAAGAVTALTLAPPLTAPFIAAGIGAAVGGIIAPAAAMGVMAAASIACLITFNPGNNVQLRGPFLLRPVFGAVLGVIGGVGTVLSETLLSTAALARPFQSLLKYAKKSDNTAPEQKSADAPPQEPPSTLGKTPIKNSFNAENKATPKATKPLGEHKNYPGKKPS